MSKRAFYLIAHKCNNHEKVNDALKKGANAIECDIRIREDQFCVDHPVLDFPPDTEPPQKLSSYLRNVSRLANEYGNRFALIIFDMKKEVSKQKVSELHNLIRDGLTVEPTMNVILSWPKWEGRFRFLTISGDLRAQEGVSIDSCDHPRAVAHFFEKYGIVNNCYANGIHDLFPGNIQETITTAINLKNLRGFIKLVYVWTINKQSTMRDYLNLGVDGIMTDDVDNLVEELASKKFRDKIRLATREESAFEVAAMPFKMRYLVNQSEREIHDLDNENSAPGGCQIRNIVRRAYFESLAEAKKAGYYPCAKCMDPSDSVH